MSFTLYLYIQIPLTTALVCLVIYQYRIYNKQKKLVKEMIELNQNKDETRDDLLNLTPQKTSTPPLQKSKDLKDFERERKKWKEQTKYLGSKTWKWW